MKKNNEELRKVCLEALAVAKAKAVGLVRECEKGSDDAARSAAVACEEAAAPLRDVAEALRALGADRRVVTALRLSAAAMTGSRKDMEKGASVAVRASAKKNAEDLITACEKAERALAGARAGRAPRTKMSIEDALADLEKMRTATIGAAAAMNLGIDEERLSRPGVTRRDLAADLSRRVAGMVGRARRALTKKDLSQATEAVADVLDAARAAMDAVDSFVTSGDSEIDEAVKKFGRDADEFDSTILDRLTRLEEEDAA